MSANDPKRTLTNRCLQISIYEDTAQFTGELCKAFLGPAGTLDSLNGTRLSAAIRVLRRANPARCRRDHQNAFTSLAPLEPTDHRSPSQVSEGLTYILAYIHLLLITCFLADIFEL